MCIEMMNTKEDVFVGVINHVGLKTAGTENGSIFVKDMQRRNG